MGGEERAQVVHVHGGRDLLDLLPVAGIPGDRLQWCDPVASGPTPDSLSLDDWYRIRSVYLASCTGAEDAATIEAQLRAQDDALLTLPADTEIVIWVGPELFCQVIMIRLLVLLEERGQSGQLSLVDPGNQLGKRGCGLEQLSAPALRDAFAHRKLVDFKMLAVAKKAWTAFTAPTATQLVELLSHPIKVLPHLSAALKRHLDDLPDAASGLSTTETHLLETLVQAARERKGLLEALAARERTPFLTDVMLEEILRRLSTGEAPLVRAAAANLIEITRTGRDVLSGAACWHAERWHGGMRVGRPEDDQTKPPEDPPNGDAGGHGPDSAPPSQLN